MQIDLFYIITDITQEQFCEVCKQPSVNNIHEECADVWWEEIVMQTFKEKEK